MEHGKHARYAIALLLALIIPAGVCSPITPDGFWKPLSNTFATSDTLALTLNDGTFHGPGLTIKADGELHEVQGIPYFNSAAIKVMDGGHTVIVNCWNYKSETMRYFFKLSADKNTLTLTRFWYVSEKHRRKFHRQEFTRVTEGPKGAHALSGTWRPLNRR